MLEEKEAQTEMDKGSSARTFQDDYFDLQVQVDANQHVTSFELGYQRGSERLGFHWDEEEGLRFSSQDGEGDSGPDDEHGFNVVLVEREFEKRSNAMDLGIASFVLETLRAYREGELAEDANPSG